MSKKRLFLLAVTVFVLALTLAVTSFAYSADLYGYVSGLEEGKEYTYAKYDPISDTLGIAKTLDSDTQLGSGIWVITEVGSASEELFVPGSESGLINIWDTATDSTGSYLAGKTDNLVPGKWAVNTTGAYKNITFSSLQSDKYPTICAHIDKAKVITPVENGDGYAYGTPIEGEGNLLQEATVTYAFAANQIVPANQVKSMTFPVVMNRTGGFAYTDGYTYADVKGTFTFTVKVRGVEAYETYTVETNVNEYGELKIEAPEAMKASKGYLVAVVYAPYANAPDDIYSGNHDTGATGYAHYGLYKGENKLETEEVSFPAPTVYDGFGVIGVDSDRTFEIAQVLLNGKGDGLELGEWTEYAYSAGRERDLAGLYAVRETYGGKVSAHSYAYAYGNETERQNILDLNEEETLLLNCAHLSSYDRALFYHGMWSGDVCNSIALGKYTLFNHSQVSLTAYNTAKSNLDSATEETLADAQAAFDTAAAELVKGTNNIKYKYAFDQEGVIPVGEAKSFNISLRADNSTFVTKTLTTKFVAYVVDRDGKITTYETKITQNYSKSFSCTVNFAAFLPKEGWLTAFEIYPNTDNTADNFLEIGTGSFRYPLTLSESSYTIGSPAELPASTDKPEGLVWEDGAITGLDKSKAYEWAQFDINGIQSTDWTRIADVSEFTPDVSGLVAVKYGGDGYSHSGSAHTYVYIPGNKMYTIINTTPTLNTAGTATIDVVDVVDAGSIFDVGGTVAFNEGKWTGLRLTNALALKYNFDRLVLGSSGTPLHSSFATAIRDAADDEAKAKAQAAAAEASANIYYSYAYKPDEIVAMSDFESFKFKVTVRQTGLALVGTVQTKFVMKVIDENDALVDRVIYKDVNYSKSGTIITVTAEDFTDLSGYIVGMVIFPYEKLGEGSYFDYSSATSGDYAVYLYDDSYTVNAITAAEKPELSLTTKNAVITVANYNDKVTYAYSDGGEWVKFDGASFHAAKASAEYTVKALGNEFFLESAVSDPVTSPAITVVGTSLVLDGSIGIKLYFDIDTELITTINLHTTKKNLDFADYSGELAYGEGYKVGGDISFTEGTEWATPATLDTDSGLYFVTFHVPAKDVDNIKIETDLGGFLDGTRVCYGNPGIDFTTYIESAKAFAAAGDAEFIKALNLIEKLEAYVTYADNYFNKGSLDEFTTENTVTADTPSRTGSLDGATFYATSLLLEDKVTIRHYFCVDDLEAYNSKYTSNIAYGEKDGYIYYDIEDISAQDIGEMQTLTIKDSEGTAYEIEYSVANYIASVTKDSDPRLVSLMNTMSEYYTAAYDYANPKPLYVKYDPSSQQEHTVESIHLYIPTQVGYIDHVFGHTVNESFNADIWRLSLAYAVDDNLENPVQITTVGEWDMALRIYERPDFIGGHAHGDEITTSIKFIIDGVETDVTTLTEAMEFKTMTIVQDSKGYDPADNVTHVLNHHKEHKVTHAGIRLDQRVEWLGDFTMYYSYLAMMPPAKTCTDSFYTNLTEPQTIDLTNGSMYVDGATSATVYGKESGIYFTMTVNEYDTYMKPLFSVSDNGGGAYNKMYFTFVKNGDVKKGDVWETFTHYKIDKKK